MADLRRCGRCGAVRPADRIVVHVYLRHRAWWLERFGPRPPAVTAVDDRPWTAATKESAA